MHQKSTVFQKKDINGYKRPYVPLGAKMIKLSNDIRDIRI